jgi:hypothetical protein
MERYYGLYLIIRYNKRMIRMVSFLVSEMFRVKIDSQCLAIKKLKIQGGYFETVYYSGNHGDVVLYRVFK